MDDAASQQKHQTLAYFCGDYDDVFDLEVCVQLLAAGFKLRHYLQDPLGSAHDARVQLPLRASPLPDQFFPVDSCRLMAGRSGSSSTFGSSWAPGSLM
jgi:hypothetical protein